MQTPDRASRCTDRSETDFFTGDPLRSLSTLSFSDNVDLQRSAALAFAEITEKEVREVGRDTLEPIMFLLQSHDVEVQRAASAALGNLAVNCELHVASRTDLI
jgi:vacuolar protein 8